MVHDTNEKVQSNREKIMATLSFFAIGKNKLNQRIGRLMNNLIYLLPLSPSEEWTT